METKPALFFVHHVEHRAWFNVVDTPMVARRTVVRPCHTVSP
jgi:hypothetical protein